jgi:hypothetical protein
MVWRLESFQPWMIPTVISAIKISSAGAANALARKVRPIVLLSFLSLIEAIPAERLRAGSTE